MMEETELEEGEALGYTDEDRDSTIDPDIAFSYIGEKVQQYLGHHQKDFEGSVNWEFKFTTGAKLNGYGTFLPTFQTSSSWSQMNSPVRADNYNFPRSPRKLISGDQRSRDASGKALVLGHFLKGKGNMQSSPIEEPLVKIEAIMKSVNTSDHSALKVRIKVGSENLSTQKNVDLCSGLGLVVSLSSSLDGSPTSRENNSDKDNASLLEKVTEINASGSQELVPNALRLPFLSSSQRSTADTTKDLPVITTLPLNVLKDGVKAAASLSAEEDGRFEKFGGRMDSSVKVSESIKANIVSDVAAFPHEDAPKTEKSYDLNPLQSITS